MPLDQMTRANRQRSKVVVNGSIKIASTALVLGIALGTASALAGVRPTYRLSIEWLTADADAIVRGRIVAVDPLEPRDRHGDHWYKARIAVAETLKGIPHDEIDFVFTTGRGEPWRWHDEQVELLFFLKTSDSSAAKVSGYDPPPDMLVLDFRAGGWSVHRLDGESGSGISEAATMDFNVLRRKDEILAAARAGVAAVAGREEPPVAYRVEVPFGTELRPKRFGMTNLFELTVPLDHRLERHAKTWANSDLSQARLEAAKALRHFRSDENIRILRKLLDDKIMYTFDEQSRRVYLIAEEAARVLEEWGEDVDRPASNVK